MKSGVLLGNEMIRNVFYYFKGYYRDICIRWSNLDMKGVSVYLENTIDLEILKGMVRMYDIDVEIVILNEIEIDGYCEVCMTLIYICTIARW